MFVALLRSRAVAALIWGRNFCISSISALGARFVAKPRIRLLTCVACVATSSTGIVGWDTGAGAAGGADAGVGASTVFGRAALAGPAKAKRKTETTVAGRQQSVDISDLTGIAQRQ